MPRSSAALTLTPPGAPQRLGDVLALQVLDVLFEVEALVRGSRAPGRQPPGPGPGRAAVAGDRPMPQPRAALRQALGQDRRRPFERHGPLHGVFELAHVAGPAVRLQAAPARRR